MGKVLVAVLLLAVLFLSVAEFTSSGKIKNIKGLVAQLNSTIQQQGALIKRMVDQDVQKQQELDAARKELNALKTGSSLTVPEK